MKTRSNTRGGSLGEARNAATVLRAMVPVLHVLLARTCLRRAVLRTGACTALLFGTWTNAAMADEKTRSSVGGGYDVVVHGVDRGPVRTGPIVDSRGSDATPDLKRQFEEAQRALTRVRAQGNPLATAATLTALAILAEKRCMYALGLAYAARARLLLPEDADASLSAALYGVLGVLQARMGQLSAAEEFLARSLAFRKQAGDREGEAATLANLGLVRLQMGDFGGAAESYRNAHGLQEACGLHAARAPTLIGLAVAEYQRGRVETATTLLDRAASLARTHEDPRTAAHVCTARGGMLYRLARYSDAIREFERACSIFDRTGDRIGRARVLLELAQVETTVGQHETALGYLLEARDCCRRRNDHVGEAAALRRAAHVHLVRGEVETARASLREARDVMELVQDPVGLLWADTEIGNVLYETGAIDEALEQHASVLSRARDLECKEAEVTAQANLALAEFASGDSRSARTHVQHAVERARRLGMDRIAMYALWSLAVMESTLGDDRAALEACIAAVELVDEAFYGLDQLSIGKGKATFADLIEFGIDLAVRSSDPEAALKLMEYGRARSLLQSVSPSAAGGSASIAPELMRARATARTRSSEALRKLGTARRRGRISAVRAGQQAVRSAYGMIEDVQRRIERASGFERLFGAKPPSLADVQAALDAGEAMVLYAIARGNTVALMITSDGAELRILGPAAPVRQAVTSVLQRQVGEPWDAARQCLQKTLIRGLRLPPDVRRLVVSPQDCLALVPFSLVAGALDVTLVPCASLRCRAPAASPAAADAILAVGGPKGPGDAPARDLHGRALPDLPGARAEALEIGTVALVDEQASPRGLLDTLATRSRWRAVHVACHALVDEDRPAASALALAPQEGCAGLLRPIDLLGVRVNADLVVLSGCGTARGAMFRAEGLVGLASAFQHAGAHRVLCSLWNVDDAATAAFMEKFYEVWNPASGSRDGVTVGEALKAAQLHVRSQPRWRDPCYWAAWVVWSHGD